MRSTVVARSMATRGKVLGAVIFFLMRSPCCMSWLSLLETSCTALVSEASSAHLLSDVHSKSSLRPDHYSTLVHYRSLSTVKQASSQSVRLLSHWATEKDDDASAAGQKAPASITHHQCKAGERAWSHTCLPSVGPVFMACPPKHCGRRALMLLLILWMSLDMPFRLATLAASLSSSSASYGTTA